MSNIKIMIVDDSSTIRRSGEMFLSKAGYEVVTVDDGLDALTRVDEENPDLIFMDVIMPKIDGHEACQIIKRNEKFKNTPIIFLSSKDSHFDKARGKMMGADDYLTKPFKNVEIVDIVKKYVNK